MSEMHQALPHFPASHEDSYSCERATDQPSYSIISIAQDCFSYVPSEHLTFLRQACISAAPDSEFDNKLEDFIAEYEASAPSYTSVDLSTADQVDSIELCIADILFEAGKYNECRQVLKDCVTDLSHSNNYDAYRKTLVWLDWLPYVDVKDTVQAADQSDLVSGDALSFSAA